MSNVAIRKIFKTSMQSLFGSIIALQIIGHLPLQNVQLPAKSIQIFELVVQIVSFDYFPFTEVWDLGFTPTAPWSEQFVFLEYETVNFIEGLGSIMIFFWLGAIYLIMVLIAKVLNKQSCCCKKVPNSFSPLYAWYTSLDFLQGIFFEVMICLSVGFKMIEYRDYLNSADYISIYNQLAVFLIMIFFIGLITYFTYRVIPKLYLVHLDKKAS